MIVYTIAKTTHDATGEPLTVYWQGGAGWTENPAHAAATADRDEAQKDADQWSDYWATKGTGNRAHVAQFHIAELEAME